MIPVLMKTLRAFNIDNTQTLKKSFHLSRNVSMMHILLSQVKEVLSESTYYRLKHYCLRSLLNKTLYIFQDKLIPYLYKIL